MLMIHDPGRLRCAPLQPLRLYFISSKRAIVMKLVFLDNFNYISYTNCIKMFNGSYYKKTPCGVRTSGD